MFIGLQKEISGMTWVNWLKTNVSIMYEPVEWFLYDGNTDLK